MNKKKNIARVLALLLAMGAFPAAFAADPPSDAPQPQPQQPQAAPEPYEVEVFHGVQIRKVPGSNAYPFAEVHDGREGWVVLDMMIDPRGKPYEVMVVDSSGNPAFEKAALRALNEVGFEPARRDGTPVDSSFTFKMKFSIEDLENGASRDFVTAYRLFTKAIEAGDRNRADAQLLRLKAQNLYEDAFTNFGKFHYHRRWGTPAEQLKDLELAIAGEEKPTYLPKDSFATALYAKFVLEVQARDYGGALETWDTLKPYAGKEVRNAAERVVEQLHAMQISDQAFRQAAVVSERNSWSSTLFRNRFSIWVTSGAVSEIKLRCSQKYLFFKYEPGVQYSIGSKKDHCKIEVVGDPGTAFELVQ